MGSEGSLITVSYLLSGTSYWGADGLYPSTPSTLRFEKGERKGGRKGGRERRTGGRAGEGTGSGMRGGRELGRKREEQGKRMGVDKN